MLLHIPTKKKTSYLHEKRKRIVNSTVRDKQSHNVDNPGNRDENGIFTARGENIMLLKHDRIRVFLSFDPKQYLFVASHRSFPEELEGQHSLSPGTTSQSDKSSIPEILPYSRGETFRTLESSE